MAAFCVWPRHRWVCIDHALSHATLSPHSSLIPPHSVSPSIAGPSHFYLCYACRKFTESDEYTDNGISQHWSVTREYTIVEYAVCVCDHVCFACRADVQKTCTKASRARTQACAVIRWRNWRAFPQTWPLLKSSSAETDTSYWSR